MKKLQLTPKAEQQIEVLNELVTNDVEYDEFSPEQKLAADAGMYANEAYVENEFEDMDDFISGVSDGEGIPKEAVNNKITAMIEQDLIVIVNI